MYSCLEFFMRKAIPYLFVSIVLMTLAGCSVFLADFSLNGKEDCRNYCEFSTNCADQSTLMTSDFFFGLSFCLFWVGFGLPIGAIFERPIKYQILFD
jgi:hypothetical protein